MDPSGAGKQLAKTLTAAETKSYVEKVDLSQYADGPSSAAPTTSSSSSSLLPVATRTQ
jgi:hypothetical protein